MGKALHANFRLKLKVGSMEESATPYQHVKVQYNTFKAIGE